MPSDAVLFIGESFAEVGIVNGGKLKASARSFLGRDSLVKFVTAFLTEHNAEPIENLYVANRGQSSILKKRHGGPTAFLVTAGFESWLELNRPVRPNHFTVRADRAPSILDANLVFGVSERIDASGQVQKPIESSDLEFLAAKLKLNNIESVAVGFLHALKNPTHENLVGQYLREQGFQVFLSHQCSDHPYEGPRWWSAVANAYLWPNFNEQLKELRSALEASGQTTTKVIQLTGRGLAAADKDPRPIDVLFGAPFVLNFWRQKVNAQAALYLGFEEFCWLDGRMNERNEWRADFGSIAAQFPGFSRLDIQATQLVQKSFWGTAAITEQEGGYEPGPMCFGKGLVPQLMDVLFLQDRLGSISGLSDKLSEKSRPRVAEALTALAREGTGRGPSPQQVAEDIEREAIQRVLLQVDSEVKSVAVCGPLATAVADSLKVAARSLGVEMQVYNDMDSLISTMVPLVESEGAE